ncbi:hypothetical protein SAMN05421783_101183 [Thiocapsa roseopersicina]|uniref:Uncharacterized protein n=1 Tax=Thiocapsa roseopersicina TaxID=1058 RepID=A0A1H2Q9S3_THIRO|nr:hypothetical protein SAMN05421783_101183 [Thiocapsa roseopersicina]
MQFYKWGDAVPEHALNEWHMLSDQIKNADGVLPVVWLDDLLRQQLGELYARLPTHFSVAAFLFRARSHAPRPNSLSRSAWECRPDALRRGARRDRALAGRLDLAAGMRSVPATLPRGAWE